MTTSAPQVHTGRMRHRAMLQKLQETPDGAGGWNTTWVDERKVWCWIRPISGSQRLENMRRDTTVSHEIFARYHTDITTDKRLLYRNRAYSLEAIWSPDERREFLQLVATEGVAT